MRGDYRARDMHMGNETFSLDSNILGFDGILGGPICVRLCGDGTIRFCIIFDTVMGKVQWFWKKALVT